METTSEYIVGVRFQPAGKPYNFIVYRDVPLQADEWVVVETTYGEQVGQVAESCPAADTDKTKMRPVIRVATGFDMARHQLMQDRAERIMDVAREEIRNSRYDLKVISAEFTLNGRSVLVQATGNAPKKDVANLRRRISSRMNCRVDLRTVGPRDQAKALGGYGICGERRCCATFLTEFKAVSIRMAKDQSISMTPTDITGMCGRLRCCLAYEHQTYKEEAKSLPRIKSRVQTEEGLGRVIDLDILKKGVIVEIPPDGPRRERKRYRFPADEVTVVPREDNNNQGNQSQRKPQGNRSQGNRNQNRNRSQGNESQNNSKPDQG